MSDGRIMFWIVLIGIGGVCGTFLRLPGFAVVCAAVLAFLLWLQLSTGTSGAALFGLAVLEMTVLQISYGFGILARHFAYLALEGQASRAHDAADRADATDHHSPIQ